MGRSIEANMEALNEALKMLAKTTARSIEQAVEGLEILSTIGTNISTCNISEDMSLDKKIAEPHRTGDEDSKGDLEFFKPKVSRGKRAKLKLFDDYSGIDLTIDKDYFIIDNNDCYEELYDNLWNVEDF